ncbi:MAG: hypothetical protein HKN79_12100, partial [Flavobacteriales bacterium]|nr:hypothetical protein [Flavobacteriales bacterium]
MMRPLRILSIATVVICITVQVQAQEYLQVIDSLENRLAETEDPDTRLKILSDGLKHTIYNDLDQALDYVLRFEKEALAYGDSAEIARSKNFFGMHASIAGDHFRAIESYEVALEWYRALQDTFMVGMMLNNIGGAYEFQADRENSIKYFKEAQEFFILAGQEDWVYFTRFNLAGQYKAVDRLLEAEPLYEQSVVYFQEQDYPAYTADAYMSLADIAFKVESPMKALELMEKVDTERGLTDRNNRARFAILMCLIHTGMENLQTASSFCDEGIALSNSYGARSKRISAYQAKYEFLKAAGRFKEALNYHEKLLSLNDSVVKAMKDKELMNMFTKYEMREKDQELELSSRLL